MAPFLENASLEADGNPMQRSIVLISALLARFLFAGVCSADIFSPGMDAKTLGLEGLAAEPGNAQVKSTIDELLRRTQPDGSVRVIVQLKIAPGPDGTLEQRIRSAQQALLAELAGAPHRVLREYAYTPALALEASHQALQVLQKSAHVLRVDEDEMLKPLEKPELLPPTRTSR
jgi:hypothetical protein